MPTYYYAEGGTAANKAAATSGTYPGGCMSPATAVSESATMSAGDFCLASDEGGKIRATITPGAAGSSGSPITWGAKAGDSPIVSGADDFLASGIDHTYLDSTGSGTYTPASTPDASPLDITGDIEFRMDLAADDWTPSVSAYLLGKWAGGTERSYVFHLQSTGKLNIETTPDGTYASRVGGWSTTGLPFGDGQRVQIRATLDVNNGSSQRVYNYYYRVGGDLSSNTPSWTQLGTTVTESGETTIHAGTDSLVIGGAQADLSGNVPAKIFRVMLYDGIGGTVELDARFEDEDPYTSSFTESSSNAATITVPGSGDNDIISATATGFDWIASGSGTNEYYLQRKDGAPWDLTEEPKQLFLDGQRMQWGTAGSLADHEWDFGDNDSLNYTTVYVRDNSGDPDTSGVTLEGGQRDHAMLITKSYIDVDGIVFRDGELYSCRVDGVGSGPSNLNFTNCEFNNGYYFGFYLWEDVYTMNNFLLEDCVADWNGGSGFQIGDHANDVILRRCSADKNGELNDDTADQFHQWNAGIKVNAPQDLATGNITIEYCKATNTYGNITSQGVGIWVDGKNQDATIVRYCWAQGNAFNGIRFEAGPVAVECYGNVCVENGQHGLHVVSSANPMVGGQYYNNTCADNTGDGIVGDGSATADSFINNTFRNNIAYGNSNRQLSCSHGAENDGTNGSGNVYNSNCFGAESSNFIEWGLAVYYSTYDSWITASSQTDNNVESDPSFTNAAGDDFSLASDSPCRDVGVDLGSPYNLALHPNSFWPNGVLTVDQDAHGVGWDMGAYVYIEATGTIEDDAILLLLRERK